MDVLKHIKYIKVKYELHGLTNLTEDLPSCAMLWIDIRLVSKDDETEEGVSLFLASLELDSPQDSVFYKLKEILYNSKDRAHDQFKETYAENKDLWVNFIREAAKNKTLNGKPEYKAVYSFKILKNVWEDGDLEFAEQGINYDFDRMLFLLESDAKELTNINKD